MTRTAEDCQRRLADRLSVIDWDWREHAECIGSDENFFPLPHAFSEAARAKKVCAVCPVRTECLEAALVVPAASDHGIWGGTSERERVRIRKSRRQQ